MKENFTKIFTEFLIKLAKPNFSLETKSIAKSAIIYYRSEEDAKHLDEKYEMQTINENVEVVLKQKRRKRKARKRKKNHKKVEESIDYKNPEENLEEEEEEPEKEAEEEVEKEQEAEQKKELEEGEEVKEEQKTRIVRYVCLACDKEFKPRGWSRHRDTPTHRQNAVKFLKGKDTKTRTFKELREVVKPKEKKRKEREKEEEEQPLKKKPRKRKSVNYKESVPKSDDEEASDYKEQFKNSQNNQPVTRGFELPPLQECECGNDASSSTHQCVHCK